MQFLKLLSATFLCKEFILTKQIQLVTLVSIITFVTKVEKNENMKNSKRNGKENKSVKYMVNRTEKHS